MKRGQAALQVRGVNGVTHGRDNKVVILGGGLTGLSAGHVLAKHGHRVRLFEADATVGGISKTILHNGWRFDLGGHRFFTENKEIERLIVDLMGDELISVPRRSEIILRGRSFDYPLKPLNAMFGFGLPTSCRIMADYLREKLKASSRRPEAVSLEEWVIRNFGAAMFEIYFKVYSEKVWGIPCDRISASWVDRRISGLSLGKAVRNALFRLNGKAIPTLVDRFLYPRLGIGRLSDRLREEIEESGGAVHTRTRVERVLHAGSAITGIEVRDEDGARVVAGREFISSIPVTQLVKMLRPAPPTSVLDAASMLRFRDLVVVAVMIDKPRATDLTWIYIPERHVPFGRIHEPTNWSDQMAPPGKTLLVTEYFSFRGDRFWEMDERALIDLTVRHLGELGYVAANEVLDGAVVRVPKAYPLFEVGHERYCEEVEEYLRRFKNLHVGGRAGKFRYLNMDHAIESGMQTAQAVLRASARHAPREERDIDPGVRNGEEAPSLHGGCETV